MLGQENSPNDLGETLGQSIGRASIQQVARLAQDEWY